MSLLKPKSVPGEIDVSDLSVLAGAREFLRMWNRPAGEVTCIIDPVKLGADPFLFGLALVDAAHHAAKAWASATGAPEEEALARIWAGVDAERSNPTDNPRQLS